MGTRRPRSTLTPVTARALPLAPDHLVRPQREDDPVVLDALPVRQHVLRLAVLGEDRVRLLAGRLVPHATQEPPAVGHLAHPVDLDAIECRRVARRGGGHRAGTGAAHDGPSLTRRPPAPADSYAAGLHP